MLRTAYIARLQSLQLYCHRAMDYQVHHESKKHTLFTHVHLYSAEDFLIFAVITYILCVYRCVCVCVF